MTDSDEAPEVLIRFRDKLGDIYALIFTDERGPMLAAEADLNDAAQWREWSGWAPSVIGLTRI